jgi:hypothetical protein
LLTGKTPFDAKELIDAGLDGMWRTNREREPLRPSTRLSTMLEGELTATAKRHGADAPKLVHLLRGDLDWIVMRCLEKDRTRRYETANGLASDIQRHLSNEPVIARPPSRLYQFQKMVRRNRVAFASGALVLLALFSGLAFSTWALFRERAARRQTAIEAAKSRQVAAFLKDMIRASNLLWQWAATSPCCARLRMKRWPRWATTKQFQPKWKPNCALPSVACITIWVTTTRQKVCIVRRCPR